MRISDSVSRHPVLLCGFRSLFYGIRFCCADLGLFFTEAGFFVVRISGTVLRESVFCSDFRLCFTEMVFLLSDIGQFCGRTLFVVRISVSVLRNPVFVVRISVSALRHPAL